MKMLRHAACVLLAAVSFLVAPAFATSFSTDQSDLWYIPSESGWGIELVQRGSVIFATLFVYGPGAEATWFTATMDATSNLTWTGTLYANTGPYFGIVPFDPMHVGITPVGTMTWAAQTVKTGTLTYSVNGVNVTKDVVRQTLVFDDFSGHYAGGFHRVFTGCANPTLNGTADLLGTTDITQNGTAITIEQDFPASGSNCTYAGVLSEAGQMGSLQVSFTCTDGTGGTGTMDEMQVTPFTIGGSFAATYTNPPGCQSSGWFGGYRGTTF